METKCEDCKVVLGSDCLENLVRLGDETAPLSGPYCDGCFEEKLDALFGLKPYIDAFFDNVMVNTEVLHVRKNRIGLILLPPEFEI